MKFEDTLRKLNELPVVEIEDTMTQIMELPEEGRLELLAKQQRHLPKISSKKGIELMRNEEDSFFDYDGMAFISVVHKKLPEIVFAVVNTTDDYQEEDFFEEFEKNKSDFSRLNESVKGVLRVGVVKYFDGELNIKEDILFEDIKHTLVLARGGIRMDTINKEISIMDFEDEALSA